MSTFSPGANPTNKELQQIEWDWFAGEGGKYVSPINGSTHVDLVSSHAGIRTVFAKRDTPYQHWIKFELVVSTDSANVLTLMLCNTHGEALNLSLQQRRGWTRFSASTKQTNDIITDWDPHSPGIPIHWAGDANWKPHANHHVRIEGYVFAAGANYIYVDFHSRYMSSNNTAFMTGVFAVCAIDITTVFGVGISANAGSILSTNFKLAGL